MRKALHRAMSIAVAVVLAGCSPEGEGSQDVPRAATEAERVASRALVHEACALLAQSDETSIVMIWPRVSAAMAAVLRMEQWAADWSAWFAEHPVSATLTACGADGATRTRMLAHMHARVRAGDRAFADLLARERAALCDFGVVMAAASAMGESAWTPVAQRDWKAQCLALFNVPDASDAPEERSDFAAIGGSGEGTARERTISPTPERTPRVATSVRRTSAQQRCPQLAVLQQHRPAIVWGNSSRDIWIAYGNALALCGPSQRPWEALHIHPSRGRSQFLRDYVIPFYDGDAVRGRTFAQAQPEQYDRITEDWDLGGG